MTVKVATKLGLDQTDPELELRLRKIEQDLEEAGVARTASNTSEEDSSTLLLSPAPFNLALTNPIENVTVTWEAEQPADFVQYEVQVDENTSFTSPSIFFTKENRFTYKEGLPDRTYFFKVRQIATNTGAGEFSIILNLGTGKIATENIQDNASKIFASQVTFSSFSLTGLGNTNRSTAVTVDNEFAKPVVVFGSYIVDNIISLDIVDIELRREVTNIFGNVDFTTIGIVQVGKSNTTGTGGPTGNWVQSSMIVATDESPPTGTATYSLAFTNSSGSGTNIFSHARIVAMEIQR